MRRLMSFMCGVWDGAAGVRALPCVVALMLSYTAFAADEAKEVHVYQQTVAGGVTNRLSDQTLVTGIGYTTQTAPVLSGYIFTHWSISTVQNFTNRDRLGRALDSVWYHLYEETTLTANYRAASEDDDDDGVADGWEMYWYGGFGENAMSDTDGDGVTFAEEIAAGTNPLIPDETAEGGIVWNDGKVLQYNPDRVQPYTVRSEPEGLLFATVRDYVKEGTTVSSGTYGTANSTFAYWTLNGVRQCDRHGRAYNTIAFNMPAESVELVAHCISDADLREQYYWYGKETAMMSDTDGDGLTLAEEIAAGTNPLMPNETVEGGIVWDQGDLLQYNPDRFHAYVIRSEPEGELFETKSDIVEEGTKVTSGIYGTADSTFAYWTLNGLRQCDRYGRAYNQVSFTMPTQAVELVAHCVTNENERAQYYWYGTATSMMSDTDHDGLTLAEEIAAGTNPLIPDEAVEGGIVWDDGEQLETDLQVYEQVRGALVDDAYSELFTSPIAGNGATSRTFADGAQVWPVVADVNGDGLWDLVVCSAATTNIFINCGSKGNPQFSESGHAGRVTLPSGLVDMNSTAKLAEMTLDVEPVGALSATTNGATLLVSDEEGRIWYYTSTAVDGNREQSTAIEYTLAHKVWGGSYAGFANGLMLAAVDWEDDGDLDCLCGTAEGKLMLLRDPKVGRPTGLKAEAGVDSVALAWDPNGQSRVRGYKVYRAEGDSNRELSTAVDSTAVDSTQELSTAVDFALLAAPTLPTYRDAELAAGVYGYKVSALSRFFTAGNSTPTETESVASEPVVATVGGVTLTWGEPVVRSNGVVEVVLSINNSLDYDATGLVVSNVYDTAKMKFMKVVASGLSEGLTWELGGDGGSQGTASPTEGDGAAGGASDVASGVVTLTVTGGQVAAGSGTFFTFVFEDLTTEKRVLLGDVSGDGVVDNNDLRLLAKLKSATGRKYTDYQLKAGDFNGNGKLDNADYQALRQMLKKFGIL